MPFLCSFIEKIGPMVSGTPPPNLRVPDTRVVLHSGALMPTSAHRSRQGRNFQGSQKIFKEKFKIVFFKLSAQPSPALGLPDTLMRSVCHHPTPMAPVFAVPQFQHRCQAFWQSHDSLPHLCANGTWSTPQSHVQVLFWDSASPRHPWGAYVDCCVNLCTTLSSF